MIAHPDLSSPPSTVVPSVRMMSPSTIGFTPSPGTTVSMCAHNSSGATPSRVPSRWPIRLPHLPLTFSAALSKRQRRPAIFHLALEAPGEVPFAARERIDLNDFQEELL